MLKNNKQLVMWETAEAIACKNDESGNKINCTKNHEQVQQKKNKQQEEM